MAVVTVSLWGAPVGAVESGSPRLTVVWWKPPPLRPWARLQLEGEAVSCVNCLISMQSPVAPGANLDPGLVKRVFVLWLEARRVAGG